MRLACLLLCPVLLLGAACSDGGSTPRLDAGMDGGEGCEPPSAVCGTRCVNLETDARNCGACGMECAGGSFCSTGACSRTCSPPLTACGASCVDVANDADHCGACDSACGEGEVCRGGACQCPEGTMVCDGWCADINWDESNCGLCGRHCDTDQVCNMGSCTCLSGSRETECDDGTDDDCDGLVDCDDDDCVGSTRPCMGICGAGVEACESGGTWGTCAGGSGETEICGDGIDQDCDGFDTRMPDSFEPNDTCDECVLLMPMGGEPTDPNVFLNARFDSIDDRVDCFRLIADDSGAIAREFIRVDLTEIPAGHDYDIYLYQGIDNCRSRTALASSTNTGNADDNIVWGEPFLPGDDSGTYYVEVRRFRGFSCTDDYRLAVNGLR